MTIRIMIQAPRGEFRTGYARIAHPVAEYLSRNKDYEIYYLCGGEKAFRKSGNKITYLPIKNDNWGGDPLQEQNVLYNYLTHFKINYNLTFLDTWNGNSAHLGETHDKAKTYWLAHQTVNTSPIAPNILKHSRRVFYHVAPSKYVYDSLVTGGFDNVELIPHFVDLKIFKPLTHIKDELKKKFGLAKEDFVFLCISKNNTGHKNIVGLLKAFQIFKKRNPELKNVKLLILSDPKENDTVSPDLSYVRYQLGLDDCVFFVWAFFDKNLKEFVPVIEGVGIPHFQSIGFSDEQMSILYNMSDVLVIPSLGESFSLPVIEAQACGVRVIMGDHSTCHELVTSVSDKIGYGVGISEEVYNPNIHAWTKIPSTEQISVLLKQAYDDRNTDFLKDCLKNAEKYDKRKILPKWALFFEKMIKTIPSSYGERLGL